MPRDARRGVAWAIVVMVRWAADVDGVATLVPRAFRDRYLDVQHLVRELMVLRAHNLTFREGDPQDRLLLFAEAAIVLVALERFLRVVLGHRASGTLPNLIEQAHARGLLGFPGDVDTFKHQVAAVRNTILHGNYEQAAREAGCSDVREYFATQFASEVETLTQLLDGLMMQIDPLTGASRWRERLRLQAQLLGTLRARRIQRLRAGER